MSSHQRSLFPHASAKLLSSLSQPAPVGSSVGVGRVRLSDGAVLKLKILIVDVKEAGFSPFGGVSFDVKVVGRVAVESLPDSVRELIGDKPFAPPETPQEGWEILDVVGQQPAEALEVARDFVVTVVAEAVMAVRNVLYRTPLTSRCTGCLGSTRCLGSRGAGVVADGVGTG
jgi:hypothetical protein